MTLGEALKQYRKAKNLLQKQLAAEIGISLKHYTLIENDRAHPSSTVLKRIYATTDIVVEFSVNTDKRVSEYSVRYKTK